MIRYRLLLNVLNKLRVLKVVFFFFWGGGGWLSTNAVILYICIYTLSGRFCSLNTNKSNASQRNNDNYHPISQIIGFISRSLLLSRMPCPRAPGRQTLFIPLRSTLKAYLCSVIVASNSTSYSVQCSRTRVLYMCVHVFICACVCVRACVLERERMCVCVCVCVCVCGGGVRLRR